MMSTSDEQIAPEPETTLAECPDCAGCISPSAETCPHCGKPFLRAAVEVVPGPRWSWTIYWGIVLFVLIPVLISAAATVILVLVILTTSGLIGARYK